jgi:mono/diheme cytochrome c family protein
VAWIGPLGGTVLMGLLLAAATIERSAAQAKKPATAPKTTLSGVYTPAQARLGEDMYYGVCVNCHPKGTYAGAGFKANWNGRPLSDLYDWVKTKMPKSEPGSLTPAESVQVMAYILQQNKMPAGTSPMPTDRNVLGEITIRLK